MSEATTVMGPFQEHAVCQMCGYDQIGTTYHNSVEQRLTEYSCPLVRTLSTRWPPTHLCRACGRCRYQWAETTLAHSLDGQRGETP